MQTDAISARLKTAGHNYTVELNKDAGQLVVDDWRLRNWITDASAPTWSAPTTNYQILSTAGRGDIVYKNAGSTVGYDGAMNYDAGMTYDGVGGTGAFWDLGYQDLGVNSPVVLPDGVTTDTPYISSVSMSAGKDLVVFYSNRFRTSYYSGIWAMRVYDDGAGILHWSEPTEVFTTAMIDDFNYQSQLFISFPILKVINNEYWIFALECSKEVNILTYHLCYLRSTDGIHWSDREYLAGVSNDAGESAVGINKHDTNTPFTVNDLKHGYLTVSGTTVYLSSKAGSKFSCPATSLVGVTNTSLQLDLTSDTTDWSLSLPAAPSAAQGTYTLQNQYKKYNNNAILVPGAILTHKAGLVTSNGAELITVSKEVIEEVRQPTQIDSNTLQVVTSDRSAWLRDWTSDIYWEYWSPQQSTYDQFCDLTALNVLNGRWFVGYDNADTDLAAATLDPNDPYDEDLGYINPHRASDGWVFSKFKFSGTVNNWLTAAIVFQGVSDRQFYSVAYWVVKGKWVVAKATPTTAGKKIYTYTPIFEGNAQTINADTYYYIALGQWHNHIKFYTSADGITWTKQLDWTAPSTEDAANISYYGLLGHSHTLPTVSLGNQDATGGKTAMDSSGSPYYWATKFTTGSSAGTVLALAGLFTQTNNPDDLTIGLVADSGGLPADVTNPNNVLYSQSMKSLNFSTSDAPVWRAVPTPVYVRVTANTSYWIYWTFNSALSAGQTWEWYFGGTGNSASSSNGIGWSSIGQIGAALAFIDYDDGLVKFSNLYYTSGESPKTIEYISQDIAAKTSILSSSTDAFVTSSDLVGNWQPSSFGLLGDFVADVDVVGSNPEIYFRAATNGDSATGYKVVVGSTITVYKNNVLIQSIENMQPIPASYHLTVSNQTRFVYVYINECLAGACYDGDLITPGYFGVGGGATLTNLRIPDMTSVKSYYSLDSDKSGQQALTDLTQTTRYQYFIDYNGTLRMGSFPRRTSVDTYSATLIDANLTNSLRYSYNELQPTGNYYARRWVSVELDRTGRRRYKQDTYTDALSNEDAYLAASPVVTRAQEMGTQNQIDSIAIFPAEREDRITVVNPLDGTSQDYIITTLDWKYSLETAEVSQKTGIRLFVS